jgi:hypothetical protein
VRVSKHGVLPLAKLPKELPLSGNSSNSRSKTIMDLGIDSQSESTFRLFMGPSLNSQSEFTFRLSMQFCGPHKAARFRIVKQPG